VRETIPGLLLAAAERNPDGVWLRGDAGQQSFSAAVGHTARIVERLHDAGVRRGDRVLVTPRTTPEDLLCWLAITSLGAIAVTVTSCRRTAPMPGRARVSPTGWSSPPTTG